MYKKSRQVGTSLYHNFVNCILHSNLVCFLFLREKGHLNQMTSLVLKPFIKAAISCNKYIH